jgi:hypothetical protein
MLGSWVRVGLLSMVTAGCAVCSSSLSAEERVQLIESAKAILESKCYSCHGPEKQEGGLRLDSREAILRGGDRGAAVVAGDASQSLLVRSVRFADPDLQMPPKQKLASVEIETLARWVQSGAPWPAPVAVLFEDDPKFLAALSGGNGKARLVVESPYAGRASLAVTPLQRDNPKIPGWSFTIRENPQSGEYRYLRLAWRKKGSGSVMLELARNGQWPDAKDPKGRYYAGSNQTGWAAIAVSPAVPASWTVVTVDLWKDIGNFTLTGCAPTCDGGEEAFLDSLILGPTIESLDAYRPSESASTSSVPESIPQDVGDAFTDARNPIRKLFRGERLDLWSLKQPFAGDPPATGVPANVKLHPIDAFLRPKQAEAGLTPSPDADARELIRRVTLDLTGLPPTPEAVDAYVADHSPAAYEAIVRRLLDSPSYGERQARLWLDVVRYADTNGYERDEYRPLAWQYRDYVIRSFNQDKPYDQFVREQLAGDELVSGTPRTADEADSLIATGYLRLGQWDSTASIFQEDVRLRAEVLADLTNTTASAFLGLTMSCCQCHDHKYDPFSQADHYRLRAFFAGVTPRDDLSISLTNEQAEIDRVNREIDAQVAPLKAEMEQLAKDAGARRDELKKMIDAKEQGRRSSKKAMGATDGGATAPAVHLLYQGDHLSPRDEIAPGFVTVLAPSPAAIESPRQDTTGRRLALARWITSPTNPWTARVAVNRLWQQHFGVGLVATPNDFGYTGARPTHPELLDWLAVELPRRGWSLKQMHFLMVTSAAYRQSSRETLAGKKVDPDNRLVWRQNMRRLDAETLRDALLNVTGLLKPYSAGKPLWPPVPEELLKAQPAILEAEKGGDGGRMQGWYPDPLEQTDVRSVFLVRKRCLPIPFLQAFDLPDTTTSCARRDTTVVAPQALMLLNSPEAHRYSQALAEKVRGASGGFDGQDETSKERVVGQLFRIALQRQPDAEEKRLASELLRRQTTALRESVADRAEQLALAELCRAVLNLNEFSYLD